MADHESDMIAYGSVISDPDKKRREALAELEKRVPDLIQQDLRKEIPTLLEEIHQESLKNKGIAVTPNMRTMARIGTLLGVLYLKAEIETRKVVRLTWGLFWLTVVLVALTFALLGLTAYLAQDAYFNRQRDKAEQSHRAEPNHSGVEAHPVTVPY